MKDNNHWSAYYNPFGKKIKWKDVDWMFDFLDEEREKSEKKS